MAALNAAKSNISINTLGDFPSVKNKFIKSAKKAAERRKTEGVGSRQRIIAYWLPCQLQKSKMENKMFEQNI